MRPSDLQSLLLCVGLISPTVFAVDRIDFSVGSLTRPHFASSTINSFRTSLTWETDDLQKHVDTYDRSLRFEMGIGLNQTTEKNIKDVTLSPILHYEIHQESWPDFFEVGVGVAYISAAHWKPYHDMGSHLLFADRIGAGYNLGSAEISVNFFHISNAGLSTPNPGADMILLRTSFKL